MSQIRFEQDITDSYQIHVRTILDALIIAISFLFRSTGSSAYLCQLSVARVSHKRLKGPARYGALFLNHAFVSNVHSGTSTRSTRAPFPAPPFGIFRGEDYLHLTKS
jgi:hypothetical protein